MTTTSVKDVGSVMNLGSQAQNVSAKAVNESFKTVWNNQSTGGNADTQQKEVVSKTNDGKAKPGDELRAKEHSQKNIRTDDVDETKMPAEEMPEENLEQAMEVIATAVNELIQQISDTMDIPVDSVREIMTQMDLEPTDLLQPENLSALLLAASGEPDSSSLLTNEQLYTDYQTLMDQGAEVLEQSSEALEITPEQLIQVVETQTKVDVEPEKPIEEQVKEPVVNVEENESLIQTADEETFTQVSGAQESDGGKEAKDSGHKDEHESGENGNVMLQSIRDEGFRPEGTESVQQTQGSADEVDTQDIMRQIMDYMKIQVKSDVSSLEMQLHPANLGTLQIQVAAKGGMLTANFITQNEAVKAALESQMVQLKESFEEQGVKVEAIEVTVQTHQFEQNLEQGRGRQPQEPQEGKRARTRRIQLDGIEGIGSAEELEQEDRITAEMMAANGNTVDYTA